MTVRPNRSRAGVGQTLEQILHDTVNHTRRHLEPERCPAALTTPGIWRSRSTRVFIVAHGDLREVVHVNVTRSPDRYRWVAQQLREATPYDSAPRFLIRDNDGKFGRDFAAGRLQ